MGLAALNPSNESWLDQVLDDFERSLLRKGLSPNTVRAYRWDVEDLFGYLQAQGITQLSDLRRDHLERWQDRMVDKHWSASTRQQAIAGVRQLLAWASDHDLCDLRLTKSLARVRKPKNRPRPIPPEDLAKIKAYLIPRRRKEHIIHLRDRALFFYLLTTGARVSEALQVTRTEIVDAEVIQKGGTIKQLMAPESTLAMVRDYIAGRADDSPWLWVSHKSNAALHRLEPAGVREIWVKIAAKVGVKSWTTHQLRHTCATELLDAGVPAIVVAEHLGHHGLGTIRNYGEIRKPARQAAVDAMENVVAFPLEPTEKKQLSRRASWARLTR